jgi:2-deoxy-D-gluconate 3-dehydrogenase
MNSFRVDGKLAIVTGATTGIGEAAAMALAHAGADLLVVGKTRDPSHQCKAIRALGRKALGLRGDIRESHFIDQVVSTALEHWGRIDILVNNAGMIVRSPAVNFLDTDWDDIIGLNLTALFRMCQPVGRQMIEQKSGKIINIASITSFIGGRNVAAYTASKGGVAQVTKALANEWAEHGVNVNAIAPGYVETEMTRALQHNPERSQEILARIPAGRWGKPEDLEGAIVFLASPASDFVHGHVLVVDGGWMAR